MNVTASGGPSIRLGPRTGLTASIIGSSKPMIPVRSGLLLELFADNISGSVGSNFSAFPDTSGVGNDATQGVMAKQFLLENGTNGKKTTLLDGLSSVMLGNLSCPQPATVFIVFKATNSGGISYRVPFDSQVPFCYLCTFQPLSVSYEIYSGGSGVDGGTPDNNWHIAAAVFNGTSSKLYLDGTLIASGDVGTTGISGYMLGSAANGSGFYQGYLSSVIAYNRDLSSGPDLATDFAYLKSYYDL